MGKNIALFLVFVLCSCLFLGCETSDTRLKDDQNVYVHSVSDKIPGLPQQNYNFTATYPNGTINRLDVLGTVGYIITPKDKIDPQRRWIWIVPLWLALNSEYGNTFARYYVEEALTQGFHVVGIDVGATCGSPKGAEVFQDFYELLVNDYNLEPNGARMLATSNGGLITYSWAFRYSQHVDRIFGIYPAVDFTSWPKLEGVVGPKAIVPAGLSFPVSTEEQLLRRIKEFNPIDNLQPLADANVPIYHIHGDADDLVPLEPNSGEAKSRYEAMGGQFDLEVFKGHGHGGMDFFEHKPARDFLLK